MGNFAVGTVSPEGARVCDKCASLFSVPRGVGTAQLLSSGVRVVFGEPTLVEIEKKVSARKEKVALSMARGFRGY